MDYNELKKLCGLLDGEIGDRIREFQATVATRVEAGDQRLHWEIDRRANTTDALAQASRAHLVGEAVAQARLEGGDVEAAVMQITGGDGAGQLQLMSEQDVQQYADTVAIYERTFDVEQGVRRKRKVGMEEEEEFMQVKKQMVQQYVDTMTIYERAFDMEQGVFRKRKAFMEEEEEFMQAKRQMVQTDLQAKRQMMQTDLQAKRQMMQTDLQAKRVTEETEQQARRVMEETEQQGMRVMEETDQQARRVMEETDQQARRVMEETDQQARRVMEETEQQARRVMEETDQQARRVMEETDQQARRVMEETDQQAKQEMVIATKVVFVLDLRSASHENLLQHLYVMRTTLQDKYFSVKRAGRRVQHYSATKAYKDNEAEILFQEQSLHATNAKRVRLG